MPDVKRILVVDDEPGICLGFAAALEGWGYSVVTAFNGKEALALVKKQAFDAIFLDLMMPKMDGFETLKNLRADTVTLHLPVVMITAKADLPDKIKAAELYVDHYITKPVTLEMLKEILDKVFPESNK